MSYSTSGGCQHPPGSVACGCGSVTTDDGLHPCDECGEIDAHQRWCTVQESAAARLLASAELDPEHGAWGWWL